MKLKRFVIMVMGFLSVAASTVSCSIDDEPITQHQATGDEADDPVDPDDEG